MQCPSCGSPDLIQGEDQVFTCANCKTSIKITNDARLLVFLNGGQCECGFFNQPDARFCGNCGKKLVKYCQNCQKDAPLATKFCPNCGKTIFVDHAFADVVLVSVPKRRQVDVIRMMRDVVELGLAEAKAMTESRSVFLRKTPLKEAQQIKARLEALGVVVELVVVD